MINGPIIRDWLQRFAKRINESSDELNRLDAALGDGDFGASMQRGLDSVTQEFAAAASAGPAIETDSVSTLLQKAGLTIVSAIGGTSGPLVGTLFLHAGEHLGGASTCTPQELAAALAQGTQAVMDLGGAAVGDKTMLDALVPGTRAFESELECGADPAVAAAAGARKALQAAEATATLVARRGRASYTGTGGAGHIDPGAMGVALMLAALADAMATPESSQASTGIAVGG